MKRRRFSNNVSVTSQRDRFTYVKLNEALRRVGETFHLIGIVKDFKLPRPSIGTDKYISIRVADETYENVGLPFTIFGRSYDDLPLVSPGDIIIVTRVRVFNRDGIITTDYHKQYSSFALYEGKSGTNFNIYQASSNFDRNPSNYTLRTEEQRITELRRWLVNYQPAIYHLKLIRDIVDNQVFSLVGKILYKQVFQGRWIIYFWDGSNAPPVIIESRLDDDGGNIVKLQLEPEPLPRDVLSTFPRSGTVLRITLGEGDMYMNPDFFRVGQFVNFDNIRCELKDDMWRAVILCDTRIRYVREDNIPLFQCQRCKFGQASLVSQEMVGCCIPHPTEITEVDPIDVPLISLVDALSCSSGVGKFKCIVRVVAGFPWPMDDFLSTDSVRLTLEDPTARIHALLCDEDREYFCNWLLSKDSLRSKLDLLVGVDGSGPRNPPWVICCLKYSENPRGSREFQIFGTKLRI